jgi:hypothetical protein
MSLIRAVVLVGSALALLIFSRPSTAQSFRPGLDCNGYSKDQKPLRPQDVCADFRGEYAQRGYDNSHYIGHDGAVDGGDYKRPYPIIQFETDVSHTLTWARLSSGARQRHDASLRRGANRLA